jgi:UV DNA damage endonuclease
LIRLGLCCIFRGEPIRFRRKTARALNGMDRRRQLEILSEICLANARALRQALLFCRDHGIGDFRINSRLLPLTTHPEVGYELGELPGAEEITRELAGSRDFCLANDLRTTFHPDQFVLLSSPRDEVVDASLEELTYQAVLAERIGSDVINIHAGGGYGDKPAALQRLADRIDALPHAVRSRLTLENDDRIYAPRELLPLCERTGIPLVYDVHHHRCLPDGMSVEEATVRALETWDREPLFHLSSPRGGWGAKRPAFHADTIDPEDFPAFWLTLRRDFTVEVEAKAKELAVLELRAVLLRQTAPASISEVS